VCYFLSKKINKMQRQCSASAYLCICKMVWRSLITPQGSQDEDCQEDIKLTWRVARWCDSIECLISLHPVIGPALDPSEVNGVNSIEKFDSFYINPFYSHTTYTIFA
jgi:hypothetical protein